MAAAIEGGAKAFPADPVTIRLSSSSSSGHPPKAPPESVTNDPLGYLQEFAREAEYEANHPRRPGEAPYKARPAIKLEVPDHWKGITSPPTHPLQQSVVTSSVAAKSVVTPMSPPKSKAEPSSSPMTIKARVEYELDENGDPVRLTPDEASSPCAAAETLASETPAPQARLVNYHDKGKGEPVTEDVMKKERSINALGLDGYEGCERSLPLRVFPLG